VHEDVTRAGPAGATRATSTSAKDPPVLGELLRLAWPIAVAQLAMVGLGLVDVAILGRTSVVGLAGAAIARTVGFSCSSLTLGVAMSLEPLASQAVGAKEPARAAAALRSTVRSVTLMWPVATAASFGVWSLLPWVGIGRAVVDQALPYMIGQAPGFLFYGLFTAYRTYLQAHGHTRPALVSALVANAVNVAVCNVLVRGDDALRSVHLPPLGLPKLGALGAGIASSFAYGLLAVLVRIAMGRTRDAGGERIPVRKVLAIGIPIGAQILAEMGVFTLVAILVGRLGDAMMSAHQIAISLASFTYMGSLGVAGATAVLVGRAVGAGGSPRRAGFAGIAVGAVMMSIPAAVFAVVPRTMASLFTHDAGVIDRAVVLLRIAAAFQLFDGVQAVAGGALRGAADVRYAFVTNVVAYWVLGLPLALVLAFGLGGGAPGLWWGLTAGLIVASWVLTRRFARISAGRIARA
jgi:MATE family multidrug resistance protein